MARQAAVAAIPYLLSLSALLLLQGTSATTFTFTNRCPYTIWPATLSGSTSPALAKSGFHLPAGATTTLKAPPRWSGRMWARTSCTTDQTGKFSCLTGDCGSGQLSCNGAGGRPPATLVEITLNGADGKDFYDTSLVDGFNVPMSITPQGDASTGCSGTACPADVNAVCPRGLQLKGPNGGVVGCRSACEAFRKDEYCCTGKYGSPEACKPTAYSKVFKTNCPQAYSYAYDDATSTFTCAGVNYLVLFCP